MRPSLLLFTRHLTLRTPGHPRHVGERATIPHLARLRPGGYHYALEVEGSPVAHHNLMVQ